MTDERVARGVALGIVAVFFVAEIISYVDPARSVPEPLYGLVVLAAGYLFGWKVMRDGRDDSD